MKRWLGLLCIGALALVGCGSDTEADAPAAAPDVQPADPLASPMEQELGFSSELAKRGLQVTAAQQQADDTMVACMRDAGFTYAVAQAGARLDPGAIADGSRAWVEVNGLGITRSLANALNVDQTPQDAGTAVAAADAANRAYVASLTAEQAAAYDSALVGDVVPDEAGQFKPAGCFGSSYDRVLKILAIVDEYEDDLITLNSRLMSDPRFQAFQQQWSGCMDGGGYRYGSEQELADDVYARLLDIELIEVEGVTQVVSPAALTDLDQYERAAAVASFDCRLGFADDAQRLRNDYEQEFLDDNRFQLAELLEAE